MTRPTSRPHDALFKSVFEVPAHAAGLLRHALPAELLEGLDLETLAHEPGSFVDEALADLHTDLLFSVTLREGASGFVYVLFEHLSAGVDDLLLRTLAYATCRAAGASPGASMP